MYAIISDGGRQYRVEEGQVLDLDYRDSAPGDQVKFDRVLAGQTGDAFKLLAGSLGHQRNRLCRLEQPERKHVGLRNDGDILLSIHAIADG